jgi:CheY-like chemotaxis protein
MSAVLLLVDDDPDDAELFRAAASEVQLPSVVQAVSSGEQALELLLRGGLKPAAILLDIKMPGIGGLETLRRLRADPAGRDVLCILLSGSDLESDRKEAERLGCDLFLTKPATFEGYIELARKIKSLIPPE